LGDRTQSVSPVRTPVLLKPSRAHSPLGHHQRCRHLVTVNTRPLPTLGPNRRATGRSAPLAQPASAEERRGGGARGEDLRRGVVATADGIYMCVCVCMCVCVYIYIERESERARERERERERERDGVVVPAATVITGESSRRSTVRELYIYMYIYVYIYIYMSYI